jgi:hypothetical protein
MWITDEVVHVAPHNYVKATIYFEDENGKIFAEGWAREEVTKKQNDASQLTGIASSYARKYALNGLFLIDDTKDADTDIETSKRLSDGRKKKPGKVKTPEPADPSDNKYEDIVI